MRKQLSEQYFRDAGIGLEIGALHCPTPLPSGASALYIEHPDWEKNHADMKDKAVKKPDFLDNAEFLGTIPSESQYGFLIANHVLEHCEDPIGTMKNWLRVLRGGSYLMVALPDKNQCFDRKRDVTTLAHIKCDHEYGPSLSRLPHYIDWFQNSELEGHSGQVLLKKIEDAVATNANIHWHVWDFGAMKEMFEYMMTVMPLRVVEGVVNGSEVIWILQKTIS